ncbi:hypothetical protein [Enterococcus faecalis]|uniref:Helix-turn-helix domain-containing protein n=1 Tax=Enterococcus faecalis TaxID=1351 RepID=A0AAW7KAZ7_ENTFL|nr:hypothetical protein [Enterococcus faecalis]MDN3072175.1 hypothetical protein [Enterococcus faecalis]MDN3093765.1 hypothetical protein [Enterococcus faecalis]MDN3191001.1 hypothetical protein [Enterococcus faecalis]RXF36001.1 hypothetical protein EG868_00725 [Enterococcus faecalis]HBC7247191.1 hypothetical protein [Enterococcus faecalis]
MQGIDFLTEQLDSEIKEVSEQIIDCQKSALELQEKYQRLVAKREYILLNEEIYVASKKTSFTKKELQKKFKLGDDTFNMIKKIGRLEEIDKRGNAKIYDLEQFMQAREEYKLWKSKR